MTQTDLERSLDVVEKITTAFYHNTPCTLNKTELALYARMDPIPNEQKLQLYNLYSDSEEFKKCTKFITDFYIKAGPTGQIEILSKVPTMLALLNCRISNMEETSNEYVAQINQQKIQISKQEELIQKLLKLTKDTEEAKLFLDNFKKEMNTIFQQERNINPTSIQQQKYQDYARCWKKTILLLV